MRSAPQRFEFFQALRLLELEGVLSGERAPIGFDASPANEALRLRAAPNLTFPAAPLRECAGDPAGQPELQQVTLTLIGALGVLPIHYTELVLRRVQLKDHALRDFLDLFHHRAASLYYRAWRKYRFAFDFEHARVARTGADDFSSTLRALVGLGTAALGRDEAHAWLHFSGLFSDPRRSQSGLGALLGDALGAPVVVEQFVGRWLELEPEQCSRLSAAPGREEQRRLGVGFVLGTRVWDVQTAVRVRVGPLRRAQFAALLPGSRRLAEVEELVRDYLDAGIACELELLLAPAEVAPARLGSSGRLGADAFLEASISRPAPVKVRLPLRTDRSRIVARRATERR